MNYVCAITFDQPLINCALIRKIKPHWQAGFLNGIGGKIEGEETPIEAMIREFQEEAGMITKEKDWSLHIRMSVEEHTIWFLKTISPLHSLVSMTEEKIEIVPANFLFQYKIIPNLLWIIPFVRTNCYHILDVVETKHGGFEN